MLSKSFVTAGRASFVVANPAGESVTVKVSKSRGGKVYYDRNGTPRPPKMWVSLRHNNEPWQWVGALNEDAGTIDNGSYRHRSMPAPDARVLSIANWALDCIWKGLQVPSGYRLEHTGRCGRCGKMLRDAESIKRGFGPECVKNI